MLTNRRGFLKSAASLAILKYADPNLLNGAEMNPAMVSSGYPRAEITCNLLLHGMFAIVFDNLGVTLLPPHVEGKTPHVYLAWDGKGSITSAQSLDRDAIYGIDLPGAGIPPTINATQNAVVRMSSNIQRDSAMAPHCSIRVPMPHYLVSLRSVFPKNPANQLFSDPTGLVTQPTQLPLVTMLKYRLGTNGIGMDVGLNYHLFAEPDKCPGDFHAPDAFNALKSLFVGLDKLQLNLNLVPDDMGPITDPAGAGVSDNDERAIVELSGLSCTPGQSNSGSGAYAKQHSDSRKRPLCEPPPKLAIHPTACMSMLFLPT